MVKKLGLIINPIAGVGGKVGLKGSDGSVTVEDALKKGGVFESNFRTLQALNELKSIKNDIELITFPSEMGQDAAEKSGFNPKVIGEIISGDTTIDAKDVCRRFPESKGDFLTNRCTPVSVLNQPNANSPVK